MADTVLKDFTDKREGLFTGLKKVFLPVMLILCSVNGFAQQEKNQDYYTERYRQPYAAEDNVRLIFNEDPEIMEGFGRAFIDVNYRYKNGRTLLFEALREFNYEPEKFIKTAKFLIRYGADVNIPDDDGDTLLLYAVRKCYISQKLDTRNIDFLLNNNADVKVVNNDGITIMYELCNEKKPEMNLIKKFIKLGAPVNIPSNNSFSPLTYALYNKNLDLAKLLIESGADANLKDSDNRYPLNLACELGNLPLASYMVSKGADVKVSGEGKRTPLHYAVGSGSKDSLKLVKFLVEKGADVNASTDTGYTPLIYAGWEKDGFELIKYLLSKKADINAKTKDGYNVGMSSARLINPECFKFLDENGFDFKACDKDGLTVLHYFIKSVTCSETEYLLYYSPVMEKEKEIEEITAFLAEKCNINTADNFGDTPLHLACESALDYTKIIEPLLKNGADVNIKTESGWTPAFYCYENPKMLQMLIDYGVDLSVKDKYGKTVLDRCEEAVKTNPKITDSIEIVKANSKVKKEYSLVQLCEYNYTDEALKVIKKEKVKDLDNYDANGFTPLYYAVINKNPELIKALLNKGCDINKRHQKDETTALYYAADNLDLETVKLLLEYKPDLSMMYKNKYSSGSANILYTCTYKSNSYKVVKCLIEAGADPNAVIEGQHGLTITAYASSGASDSTVIELLIEHGGNPFATWNVYWNNGYTEKRSIISKDLEYSTKNSVYEGLVNYYKNKNLTATDNLRLRDSYSRSGRTLTAIKKGTKVKVIDAYNMEIIDDIHSCWVKVEVLPGSVDSEGKKLADDTTGWCILGYLE